MAELYVAIGGTGSAIRAKAIAERYARYRNQVISSVKMRRVYIMIDYLSMHEERKLEQCRNELRALLSRWRQKELDVQYLRSARRDQKGRLYVPCKILKERNYDQADALKKYLKRYSQEVNSRLRDLHANLAVKHNDEMDWLSVDYRQIADRRKWFRCLNWRYLNCIRSYVKIRNLIYSHSRDAARKISELRINQTTGLIQQQPEDYWMRSPDQNDTPRQMDRKYVKYESRTDTEKIKLADIFRKCTCDFLQDVLPNTHMLKPLVYSPKLRAIHGNRQLMVTLVA